MDLWKLCEQVFQRDQFLSVYAPASKKWVVCMCWLGWFGSVVVRVSDL